MNEDFDTLSETKSEGLPAQSHPAQRLLSDNPTIDAHTTEPGDPVFIPTPEGEVKPTILTKAEHGKLMRQYWTVTHPRVVGCNHRLDLSRDPRHNCESCWFAYFTNNEKLVEEADAIYIRDGQSALKDKYGRKFVPKFFGFMSTMANWKNTIDAAHAAEEANPTPEVSAAA